MKISLQLDIAGLLLMSHQLSFLSSSVRQLLFLDINWLRNWTGDVNNLVSTPHNRGEVLLPILTWGEQVYTQVCIYI